MRGPVSFIINFTNVVFARCYVCLGQWVRSRVIICFCVFEILICFMTGLLFKLIPSIARMTSGSKNAILFNKALMGSMSIRSVFSIIGILGSCRRKVKTTRMYLSCLPVGVLCSCWVCFPLLKTDCECSNYDQCEILVGFSRGSIMNRFPQFTWEAPPIEEHELDGDSRRLHADYHEEFTLREKFDDLFISTATERNFTSSRRLVGDLTQKDSLPDSYRQPLRVGAATEEEAAKKVSNLLMEKCTCDGPDLNYGSGEHRDLEGRTCSLYTDEEDGQVKSWCLVRRESLQRCKAEYQDNLKYVKPGRRWTTEICDASGCDCSRIGMYPPREEEIHPDRLKEAQDNVEELEYGNGCKLWRKSDVKKWCFVGFDTKCAKKKWVNLYPPNFKFDYLEHVAQYYSELPCQEDDERRAGEYCMAAIVIVTFFVIVLNITTMPIAIIVWIFLNNRCGDNFVASVQFDVDLSDEDEEYDFDVDAEHPELGIRQPDSPSGGRKKKAKSGTSKGKLAGEVELGTVSHTISKKSQGGDVDSTSFVLEPPSKKNHA